ncbi:MAG: signal recognition particle-docking protein FtsY [Candidatus Micrarchaeia archaeon]|jgi:fused signal recognition particle receptor
MFGLLKNKLASFIKGLSGKEESKEAPAQPLQPEAPRQEEKPREAEKAIEGKKPAPMQETRQHEGKKKAPAPSEEKKIEPAQGAKPAEAEEEPSPARRPGQAPEPKKEEKKSIIEAIFHRKEQPKPPEAKAAQPAQAQPREAAEAPRQPALQPKPPEAEPEKPLRGQPRPSHAQAQPGEKQAPPSPQPKPSDAHAQKQADYDLSRLERKASSEKRETAPRIGIGTALKSIFSSEITIGESEVADLLSELELSLLEADVAYDVSLDVSSQLRNRLVGMKVPKGKVEEKTREAIKDVLASVMKSERKFDLVSRVRSLEKPAKILFVGPNGAGKTTTMAKIARMLLDNGLTAVFSASDTFRAAAIEQTEVHAGRLGVKVVKSRYGADPASVAFDAVNFARTHGIDVVLIDSAGRQDTNANLLDELRKISRVAKPDIKIYIGESIGGNALIDQVRAFDAAIGMDGAILTKIDCDAKGGTALSLTKSTGIPVLYLGVGQAYSDLVAFDPDKIAQEIMS